METATFYRIGGLMRLLGMTAMLCAVLALVGCTDSEEKERRAKAKEDERIARYEKHALEWEALCSTTDCAQFPVGFLTADLKKDKSENAEKWRFYFPFMRGSFREGLGNMSCQYRDRNSEGKLLRCVNLNSRGLLDAYSSAPGFFEFFGVKQEWPQDINLISTVHLGRRSHLSITPRLQEKYKLKGSEFIEKFRNYPSIGDFKIIFEKDIVYGTGTADAESKRWLQDFHSSRRNSLELLSNQPLLNGYHVLIYCQPVEGFSACRLGTILDERGDEADEPYVTAEVIGWYAPNRTPIEGHYYFQTVGKSDKFKKLSKALAVLEKTIRKLQQKPKDRKLGDW